MGEVLRRELALRANEKGRYAAYARPGGGAPEGDGDAAGSLMAAGTPAVPAVEQRIAIWLAPKAGLFVTQASRARIWWLTCVVQVESE